MKDLDKQFDRNMRIMNVLLILLFIMVAIIDIDKFLTLFWGK